MLIQDLSHVSLFQGLSQSELGLIQPLLEICDYSKDSTVFEQDDPAHFLYIVTRGEVVVRYKAYDGPVITVSRVGPGGIFGWSSALGRVAYSSGAVCVTDSEFYRISGLKLRRFCAKHPETGLIIVERLANVIDERLQSTHSQFFDFLSKGVDRQGEITPTGRTDGSHELKNRPVD